MSQVIFKNAHYVACQMSNGMLIVHSNRIQKGKAIQADEAKTWIKAIKESIDDQEAHALCRAVYNA